MTEIAVGVHGLDDWQATLTALSPAQERKVYSPSLTAMARVVRNKARERNFIFRDGKGARAFNAEIVWEIPVRAGNQKR